MAQQVGVRITELIAELQQQDTPKRYRLVTAKKLRWLKGHPVLVDFWASWCVPCIQQMRSLSKLAEKANARD